MHLQVLGAVQATDNGEAIALGGPRQRAVLALLVAFANQPLSSDRIIDEIWGEEPPPQARNSLQAMISNLRKALAGDDRFAIDRNGRSYQLIAPEDGVDSLLFASQVEEGRRLVQTDLRGGIATLEAALELWKGAPYSDVDEADTLRADGARLEEMRLRAVETRIEAELAAGRAADVVGDLERLVDQEPLREGLYRLLMLALVEARRQGEALRVAGRLRQTLAAELGIEPSPELAHLEQQILDQTFETPATKERAAANPYRGLESFTEADADRFFGRDKLTALLVERMAETGEGHRLLAVVGASGSGKSSVVRAGLIPALRRGAVPGSADWVVVQMVPGASPLRDLEAALLRVAVNPPPTLLEQLTRDGLGLRDAAERILPEGVELVLVIDQFEELFTAAEPEASDQLIAIIVGAVTATASRVRVVITLRADFYDRPLVHPGLAPLLAKRQETVVAMTPDELSEAIVEPAAQVGVAVEPALVGTIIGDASGQPGSLPMLQYTMTELFDRRSEASLTLDGYESFGGLRGAIGRRAEAAFGALDSAGQRAVRVLFLQLVTLREADEATRRRALVADLPDKVDSGVIDSLVDARLLSLDQDTEGRPTVEVAHEALLREWPRLAGWIEEGREDIRTHLRLRAAANEWVEAGQQSDYLIVGQKLATFEAWSQTTDRVIGPSEADLLERSFAARDEQLRREASKRRRTTALLVAGLLGALLLAGFAVVQANLANAERDQANLRGLTATALEVATEDNELGVLLAIEAVERRATDATVEALHNTLAGHYLKTSLPAPTGGAAFIADNIAALNEDGTISVYDLTTRPATEIRRIGEPGWIETDLEFPGFGPEALGPLWMEASHDGSVLLVATGDGSIVAVDVATGSEKWRAAVSGTPPELSLSSDGKYVAARGYEDAWTEWPPPPTAGGLFDVATGEKIVEFGSCCTAAVAMIDNPVNRVLVEQVLDGQISSVLIDVADGSVVDAGDDFFAFIHADANRDISISVGARTVGEVAISQPGQQRFSIELHEGRIWDLELSPDTLVAASASVDGTAQVWSARTREVLRVIRPGSGAVWDVAFSLNNELMTTGSDGIARVWSLSTHADAEVLGYEGDQFTRGSDLAERRNFAAFTAADRQLHFGQGASRVSWVFNPADGSRLIFPWFAAESVTMVPGTELAAMGRKGKVTFVDLTNGVEVGRIDVSDRPGEFRVLEFAPSGDRFVFGTEDGRIELVDREGGVVGSLDAGAGAQFRAAVYDDADRLWTIHAAGTIRLWGEQPRAEPVAIVEAGSGLGQYVAAFGSRIVVATPDGGFVLVDTEEAEVAKLEPFAHTAPITALAAHGDVFVTGDASGVIKLWDLNTGEARMTLPDVGPSAQVLDFNSDGSHLAVATRVGFRVFALDTDELLQIARSRVSREITDAECEQYLAAFGCN